MENFEKIKEKDVDELKDVIYYVPDVIKTEKKTYFFTIPRFGAQLAIKLNIESFLNDKSYEDGLTKLIEYNTKK